MWIVLRMHLCCCALEPNEGTPTLVCCTTSAGPRARTGAGAGAGAGTKDALTANGDAFPSSSQASPQTSMNLDVWHSLEGP